MFIIVFVGFFAFLYAALPADFFIYQGDYDVIYQEASQIREQFSILDLALYSNYGNDSMTYEYTSIEDAPDPPQWATSISNRFIEIWWGLEDYEIIDLKTLEVRDTEERDFLGVKYYVLLERCNLFINGENIGSFFTEDILEDYENETQLVIDVQGSFIASHLILRGNDTDVLGNSWYADILEYSLNYEIDFEAMKPNAFLLIGQLISFQSPEFGIPGLFGEIISYIVGVAFWAVIILISYTVITKLIPTISGGLEG